MSNSREVDVLATIKLIVESLERVVSKLEVALSDDRRNPSL